MTDKPPEKSNDKINEKPLEKNNETSSEKNDGKYSQFLEKYADWLESNEKMQKALKFFQTNFVWIIVGSILAIGLVQFMFLLFGPSANETEAKLKIAKKIEELEADDKNFSQKIASLKKDNEDALQKMITLEQNILRLASAAEQENKNLLRQIMALQEDNKNFAFKVGILEQNNRSLYEEIASIKKESLTKSFSTDNTPPTASVEIHHSENQLFWKIFSSEEAKVKTSVKHKDTFIVRDAPGMVGGCPLPPDCSSVEVEVKLQDVSGNETKIAKTYFIK